MHYTPSLLACSGVVQQLIALFLTLPTKCFSARVPESDYQRGCNAKRGTDELERRETLTEKDRVDHCLIHNLRADEGINGTSRPSLERICAANSAYCEEEARDLALDKLRKNEWVLCQVGQVQHHCEDVQEEYLVD